MNRAPRLGGRNVQVLRSQLALEVALTVYAAVVAALLVRLGLLALAIPARVWSGEVVYAATAPFVAPLTRLPGGTAGIFGAATLADVTTFVIFALVPLVLLARDRSR